MIDLPVDFFMLGLPALGFRRGMLRGFSSAAAVACLSLLVSAIPPACCAQIPAQPSGPALLKMRVEGNAVTAEIRNAPLQQVLEELAARTGIVFEVGTQDNPPLAISLYRSPLQEAIQRLVGNNNALFYFGRDTAGQEKIELVRVFSRSNKPAQPSLRYIGTGKITKTLEDTIENPEQALKALAESKQVDVRQKAIEVLVAAKGDVAIQALTAALADDAPEVRVAAIEGLAGLGARSVLPEIVKCLKDPQPGVRQSAITAIALLGDADNIKDLKPMSKDKDASVAAAADVALRKLAARRL